MNKMKSILIIMSALFCLKMAIALPDNDPAEEGVKKTLSGYIRDVSTGEDLPGATVFIEELKTGTTANMYGFYSISLNPGTYSVVFTYIGFQTHRMVIDLTGSDITYNVDLEIASEVLDEVVITGEALNENVTQVEMSSIKMDVKTIRKIPALMGEVDIIKAIQLLPGVQSISEGSSGFSVRGGSIDQNLVLLDEATVYNASHLMGFFSVFNNDAIKDVKLYKGDIPASAGGRLSSLLDVRMKDGSDKKITGTGGIGTISSRLTLEGPLQKDKASFVISGRRTYADLFLRLSSNEDLRDNILYFYDFNAKVNYEIDENNRVFLSAYYGKDVFKNPDFRMGWGNRILTARWNHLFSKKLFSNFTLIHSDFDYELGVPEGSAESFSWMANLRDYGFKSDLTYYINTENTLRFGFSGIYHKFKPGRAVGLGTDTFFGEYEVQENNAFESAVYVSNEQKFFGNLTLKYGLRFSHFQNVGASTIYNYDDSFNVTDSTVYETGEFFSPYYGLEPRIGLAYMLNEFSSIKASYSRTRQYIHLAQNSTAGTPLDVWFPSSPNVKPQIADQYALGYFRNFRKNTIEASVEAYYKKVDHAIDFKDHADLLLNKYFEGELRFGESWSYGLEFLVNYNLGKANGWVSYTLSKTERKFDDINFGRVYPATYDKPHDVSIVLNYELSRRITMGATWVYSTGSAVTFPTGRFVYGNKITPVFSDRNEYRMPDYHRLDFSITLRDREQPGKKWYGEWNLSVYNAYARKNPWVINFVQDENDPSKSYAEMTYLFSIIPSITYNFHF
ncbi:MAG: TonB-dependent receptor [Bacteroidales bacterium]|nr:TonB-dependent receptor [Bacteroidales bacterium]